MLYFVGQNQITLNRMFKKTYNKIFDSAQTTQNQWRAFAYSIQSSHEIIIANNREAQERVNCDNEVDYQTAVFTSPWSY